MKTSLLSPPLLSQRLNKSKKSSKSFLSCSEDFSSSNSPCNPSPTNTSKSRNDQFFSHPSSKSKYTFNILNPLTTSSSYTIYKVKSNIDSKKYLCKVYPKNFSSYGFIKYLNFIKSKNLDESVLLKIIDSFEDENKIYVVLEKYKSVLTFKDLSEDQKYACSIKLLSFLMELNLKGVSVTRLYPFNVVLLKNGEYRLADLDFLTFHGNISKMSSQGHIEPKVVRNNLPVRPSTDSWAYGLLLVYIFHGKLLCSQKVVNLKEEICEMSENNNLNNLIRQCLKEDPLERPNIKMLIKHPFFIELFDKNPSLLELLTHQQRDILNKFKKCTTIEASFNFNDNSTNPSQKMMSPQDRALNRQKINYGKLGIDSSSINVNKKGKNSLFKSSVKQKERSKPKEQLNRSGSENKIKRRQELKKYFKDSEVHIEKPQKKALFGKNSQSVKKLKTIKKSNGFFNSMKGLFSCCTARDDIRNL